MNSDQLAKLSEEIKLGHKFLRGCKYDAKTKRLELRLGSDAYEGGTKSIILQEATEPSELAKWIGHEIYGTRNYQHLDHTEVRLDLGQTVAFDIQDETEADSDKEDRQA